MKIPNRVKKLFNNQDLVSFGTADKKGSPNVAAIFWKKILSDDIILLIDNFMKRSKKNVIENKKVCVSFWDSKTEEAYKVKGNAKYYTKGPVYEKGKKHIQTKQPKRVPKGVVEIKATEIYDMTPGPDAGKKL